MKTILVIEDNTEVRENLAEILELSGYRVLTAENGKQGAEIAIRELPELVLCDVMMPELDGFGVLHILQKREDTASIPLIFLTAKADKADIRKGMNLGADDYITKPFDDVELLNAVEMRLKKNQRQQTSQPAAPGLASTLISPEKGIDALKQLANDREIRFFRKKDIIFQENTYPKQVYYIHNGKVKIFKTNDDGKEYIVDIAGQGSLVGYLSLLAGSTYTESAAALEDSEISVIPKDDFLGLLNVNKDAFHQVIKNLAGNVVEKETQLLDLAYDSVRRRVAKALLFLHKRFEQHGEKSFTILREDLASIVGTAKETVIRTLTDFKQEKLIDIEDHRITILNKEKLANLPN